MRVVEIAFLVGKKKTPEGDMPALKQKTAEGNMPTLKQKTAEGDMPTLKQKTAEGNMPTLKQKTAEGDMPTLKQKTAEGNMPTLNQKTAEGDMPTLKQKTAEGNMPTLKQKTAEGDMPTLKQKTAEGNMPTLKQKTAEGNMPTKYLCTEAVPGWDLKPEPSWDVTCPHWFEWLRDLFSHRRSWWTIRYLFTKLFKLSVLLLLLDVGANSTTRKPYWRRWSSSTYGKNKSSKTPLFVDMSPWSELSPSCRPSCIIWIDLRWKNHIQQPTHSSSTVSGIRMMLLQKAEHIKLAKRPFISPLLMVGRHFVYIGFQNCTTKPYFIHVKSQKVWAFLYLYSDASTFHIHTSQTHQFPSTRNRSLIRAFSLCCPSIWDPGSVRHPFHHWRPSTPSASTEVLKHQQENFT